MAHRRVAIERDSKEKESTGTDGMHGNNSRITILLIVATALAIAATVAVALLSTIGDSPGRTSFTPNDEGLLQTGTPAPRFTADTVNEVGSVTVGGGNEEATILVFFASWCPHCNDEAPVIADIEEQYGKDLRVVMVGIDDVRGDNPQAVRDFVERHGIEGAAVYEPWLGQAYQVGAYPTIYVLDADGRIAAAHQGVVPKDALESWIEKVI